MKHLIITLISFTFIQNCGFSQYISCDYGEEQMRVISKTGLELKSGAKEESKTLLAVPYWTKVNVCTDFTSFLILVCGVSLLRTMDS